jgi:hypothetical protein
MQQGVLLNYVRLEKDMKPASEATKLEGADGFLEYVAAGKLKGKKAFITGGEYVSFPHHCPYS